jgi:hypothetical protein
MIWLYMASLQAAKCEVCKCYILQILCIQHPVLAANSHKQCSRSQCTRLLLMYATHCQRPPATDTTHALHHNCEATLHTHQPCINLASTATTAALAQQDHPNCSEPAQLPQTSRKTGRHSSRKTLLSTPCAQHATLPRGTCCNL